VSDYGEGPPPAPPAATYVREATITYGPRKRSTPPRIAASTDVIGLEPVVALRDELREHFLAIALDAKNRPLAWHTISIGSMTACPVAPADVLRFCILAAAPALVVVHNHPSGDPAPSPEDIALTDRLVSACRLVGVQLVDHVIVAEQGHFSFLDAGLLAKRPK
jgi:DNA repair protein RadC